jgi:hypothetical protein
MKKNIRGDRIHTAPPCGPGASPTRRLFFLHVHHVGTGAGGISGVFIPMHDR